MADVESGGWSCSRPSTNDTSSTLVRSIRNGIRSLSSVSIGSFSQVLIPIAFCAWNW